MTDALRWAITHSWLARQAAAARRGAAAAARDSRFLGFWREPWVVPAASGVARLADRANRAGEIAYGRLHASVAAAVPASAALGRLRRVADAVAAAGGGWLDGSLLVGWARDVRAAVWHPVWGFGLVALTVPFVSNEMTLVPVGLAVVWTAAWALATGGWQPVKTPATLPVMLFLAAITVAAVTSVTPTGSLRDWVINVFGIALAFALAGSLSDRRQVVLLLGALGAAAAVTAAHGFYQFVFGAPQDRAWVDPLIHPGLVRVYAGFGNPNVYSEYLLLAAPAALALAYVVRRRLAQLAWAGVWLALLAALVLTYSRGAWVAMVAGLAAFAWLRDRRILAVFLLLAVLGATVAPATVLNRMASITSLEDSSNRYRVGVWGVTLRMIEDFWATGVGLGFRPYQLLSGRYTRFLVPFHAHNTYLQFLAELGIVGFAVFLWMLLALGRLAWAAVRRDAATAPGTVMAALLAALVGFFFHGLVEHVIYLPKIILTFWLLVGVLLAAHRLAAGEFGGPAGGAAP